MDKREVIKNTIDHRDSGVVPYSIGFTQEAQQNMADYYNDPEFQDKIGNFMSGVGTGSAKGFEEVKSGFWKDEFGVVWDRTVDKDIGVPLDPPVTPDNVTTFEMPDPDDPTRYDDWKEHIENTRDQYCVANLGFSLYERAWILAGMENVLTGMVIEKEFVHTLLDRITDFNLKIIANSIQDDIDAMMFGDDWGQQNGLIFGKELWIEFIKPRIAKMYKAVKDAGKDVFIHSCGKVEELYPDLIECGLDVFNPFQPEVTDVFKIKEEFGDRLTFFGGISTQKTLPYGTPEETRKEVEALLKGIGVNGGYIASPAHSTPADAKPENIAAMIDVLQNQ